MEYNFVIGPANAGKSTFIKEHFPDAVITDVYDFQECCNYNHYVGDVWISYLQCAEDIVSKIQNNYNKTNCFVLEHTLLLAKRRPMFIESVKQGMFDYRRQIPNYTLNVYVIEPFDDDSTKQEQMNFMEMPTYDEGFDNIYIVNKDRQIKRLENKNV